ncbi:MAG: carbamoyl-phosphate synthase large subunit [Chitinophagales bacterium]|nr:carbamoyl-phosphate synthase large subunit [Bacteroidota bacterium]
MPKKSHLRSVLIIGSGPIIIGQACEFDYSGSQAARSLREEGIEVVLINSNPATIMTDKVTADHIYLLPLTVESIIHILDERKIDAVLPTMGGQTALNLAIEADQMGIWERYGVEMIGVDVNAIEKTENRELFRQLMQEIGVDVARSHIANSYLEGKDVAQQIGFPLVIRPSYTLGGTGGGFVHSKEFLDEALKNGLEASPTHEVLVEEAVLGWREYELELLRDANDNVIIICTIENLDPMGVHTGDSITVAPAMTLPDTAYQYMRDLAIKMMRSLGNFAGGCNVQFAYNPDTEKLIAIEINPRVSRSSALASKATGYPIAKIAAKLAVGYTLDELKNQITQTTSAFFEPALDYVIVKIPRWNFNKFEGSNKTLGLQMKSVGEVMGIGRSFNEALQKACQSLETNHLGLGADGVFDKPMETILQKIEHPSWDRIFAIKAALEQGVTVKTIQQLSRIDTWFLNEIKKLVALEKQLKSFKEIENVPKDLLLSLKRNGFADTQIAYLLGNTTEDEVYTYRTALGMNRTYCLVDTCAAEFEAQTPYFYSSFEQSNESVVSAKPKIVVLGAGPNRIGQGIEFDYCCVHGVMALREEGYEAIMVNCNPETVSTDFDISDKLYFEPIFWEHVRDILAHEKPDGVIVQLGGQTALKLSEKIQAAGYKIIGTSYENMDLAEDRGLFSQKLQELQIPYPRFGVALDVESALEIAHQVGYPVLVRPSYVLGGQRMKIVINDEELEKSIVKLLHDLPGNRILIDHFLDRATEAEIDAICDGEEVYIMGIMEHIEPAGIHSGDSNSVLPSFSLGNMVIEQMKHYTRQIALALGIKGLINIQFAVKDNMVYVIEANPRASRSMPFICKAYQVPFLKAATKIMLGTHKISDFQFTPVLEGYAIKKPVFSFNKFPNVNKELGPEMKSTGEEILFVKNTFDPQFRKLYRERSMYLSR